MFTTADRFAQGLTFDQFVEKYPVNGRTFRTNYEDIEVDPETVEYFRALAGRHGGKLDVVVVAADWCPDAQENVPIIAKLASVCPFMEVRLFDRDADADIMDQLLSDGRRTIPAVAILDSGYQEIGRWIERPRAAHDFLREGMKEVRQALRARYHSGDFRQETLRELVHATEER